MWTPVSGSTLPLQTMPGIMAQSGGEVIGTGPPWELFPRRASSRWVTMKYLIATEYSGAAMAMPGHVYIRVCIIPTVAETDSSNTVIGGLARAPPRLSASRTRLRTMQSQSATIRW